MLVSVLNLLKGKYMKKNSFIPFFFSFFCIYILHFVWFQFTCLLLNKDFVLNILIFLSIIGIFVICFFIKNKLLQRNFKNNILEIMYNKKAKVLILILFVMLYSLFPDMIEFTSSFISYWIMKKFFSNNTKIQNLFLNYKSVKKYAIGLLAVECSISILLVLMGVKLEVLIFLYLICFSHIFCFIWYLPFLIMSFINKNNN